MKKQIRDKIIDRLVMIVESPRRRVIWIVTLVLLLLAFAAFGITLTRWIWESDLPDWVKIMLLR